MVPDKPSAIDGWTRSPLTGVLSCSVGPWGERKRLFQKRADGPFYCSVPLTDGQRHVRGLSTADHAEALRIVTFQTSKQNGLGAVDGRDGHDDHEPRPCVTLGRL